MGLAGWIVTPGVVEGLAGGRDQHLDFLLKKEDKGEGMNDERGEKPSRASPKLASAKYWLKGGLV